MGMSRLVVLLLVALLAGCAVMPDAVVVNGVSQHVVKSGRDSVNPGIGVRRGSVECGAYDNSRVKRSFSYYCVRDVAEYRGVSFRAGAAWYDGMNGYDAHAVPVGSASFRFGVVESGYLVPDILFSRLVFDL